MSRSTSHQTTSSLTSTSTSTSTTPLHPPRFTLNLSDPPATRWNTIVDAYASKWPTLVTEMMSAWDDAEDQQQASAFVSSLSSSMLSRLTSSPLSSYASELRGIATRSGLSLESLMLLNLSYEANTACTAIVTRGEDGNPFLGRTLDWESASLLRSLVIDLDVVENIDPHDTVIHNNNTTSSTSTSSTSTSTSSASTSTPSTRLLYRATTFAGYIGLFTALHVGVDGYAIAINFRDTQHTHDDDNDGTELPIGIVTRYALENHTTYDKAVAYLSSVRIMAPCYIVMCSTRQAVCITRGESGEERRLYVNVDAEEEKKKKKEQKQEEIKTSSSSSSSVLSRMSSLLSSKRSRHGTPSTSPSHHPPESRSHLIQANLEHWIQNKKQDHQSSLERTILARQMILESSSSLIPVLKRKDMWRILCRHPIWEDDVTIYATVMSCQSSTLEHGEYQTIIHVPEEYQTKEKSHGKKHKKARYHKS